MTRKRYIKLMMAEGFDRNTANAFAEQVQAEGKSYSEDYADHVRLFRRIDFDALCVAMQNVTDTIRRVGKALCSAVAAFSKAYTEAMSKEERL